ncbi:MAG: YlxR family protein [Myxococcales bacterium]
MRTCIGCGARREKAELVRLVARDGKVEVDAARRAPGRGAYVCDGECARKASQKRAFGRAFKAKAVAGEELPDGITKAKVGPPSRGAAVDPRARKI